MRVTIEHREQAVGSSGHNYFVDCKVEFSEEEKAIIQTRSLADRVVIDALTRAPPPPVLTSGPFWMRLTGPLLVFGGVIVAIQSMFTKSGEGLSFLMLLIGGGFWFFGAAGMSDREAPQEPVPISVGRLMGQDPVSMYAPDPAAAKALDEQFREGLVGLKQLISASAELRGKETFEL